MATVASATCYGVRLVDQRSYSLVSGQGDEGENLCERSSIVKWKPLSNVWIVSLPIRRDDQNLRLTLFRLRSSTIC